MIELPSGFVSGLLDTTCEIQQIPAPTFSEGRRADYVQSSFEQLGLSDVHRDTAGNVLGCIPGREGRPLVITAHMDTVHPDNAPILLNRQPHRISGRAIGDNSLGLVGLIHLGRLLLQHGSSFPGDIWLVGSVAEEGLGNLAGMRAVVDRFEGLPIAYLVVEGIGFGNIYHQGLAVERYRITVRTAGGHSWADFGNPSAIHELAGVISRITAMPLPERYRTSLNVGVIEGGTSINTIASQATALLDLRSENGAALGEIANRISSEIRTTNQAGIEVSLTPIGNRPAGRLAADHPLVKLARECIAQAGFVARLGIASTEANIPLSRGYPSVCIGLTTGGNVHTDQEYVDTGPLIWGIQQLLQLVQRVWEIQS